MNLKSLKTCKMVHLRNSMKSQMGIENVLGDLVKSLGKEFLIFQRILSISWLFRKSQKIWGAREEEERVSQKNSTEGRHLFSTPISAWINVLSHISIPDTGDNGPIWRWFFTLSNLFRLVVVSLARLFILNFLGMRCTVHKSMHHNGWKMSTHSTKNYLTLFGASLCKTFYCTR